MDMTFGEKLWLLREEHELNQTELGKKLSMTQRNKPRCFRSGVLHYSSSNTNSAPKKASWSSFAFW